MTTSSASSASTCAARSFFINARAAPHRGHAQDRGEGHTGNRRHAGRARRARASGEALFLDDFSHHVPSLVLNSVGKGKTAYLNFGVDSATDASSPQGKAIIGAIEEVFDWFGMKPIMRVAGGDGKPISGAEMFHYRVPGVDYFALLRENVGAASRVAYDGIVHAREDEAVRGERISVSLPVSGHVYDVLAKRYIGFGDQVESEIEPAEAKVWAVYPYQVKDLRVFVEAQANRVEYDVETIVSDGKPREHTVAMEVVSPAGEVNRLYSANILAKGGRAHGRILFGFEGESGAWTLMFTEAASGITKSVEVIVP